jgi:hypothetical protein
MRTISAALHRIAIACVVAVVTLVGVTATPAAAASSRNIKIYGAAGAYLGWGAWQSYPVGEHRNGKMWVKDEYCDGDNGIIAALYVWTGEGWSDMINVVSQRGCNQPANTIPVKHYTEGGPEEGKGLLFRVCKLTPAGVWKDCKETFPINA